MMNAKEETLLFVTLLKNICVDRYLSQSQKMDSINQMIQNKIPKDAGYKELDEIAKALSSVSHYLVGEQNKISKFFTPNPCCSAMNNLMERYIHHIKRDIEEQLNKKNVKQFDEESLPLFNRALLDALSVHESTLTTMFLVNSSSFLKIYDAHRLVPNNELTAESQDKVQQIEDYEKDVRDAFLGSGINIDSFK